MKHQIYDLQKRAKYSMDFQIYYLQKQGTMPNVKSDMIYTSGNPMEHPINCLQKQEHVPKKHQTNELQLQRAESSNWFPTMIN